MVSKKKFDTMEIYWDNSWNLTKEETAVHMAINYVLYSSKEKREIKGHSSDHLHQSATTT